MSGHPEPCTSRYPSRDRLGRRPLVTKPAAHLAKEPQDFLELNNWCSVLREPGAHATPAGQPATAVKLVPKGASPRSKPSSVIRTLLADGRAPLIWGAIWGVIQAAAPLGFWWLDGATVYGLSIALIATVYIGFAVADGRPTVIAVETIVAGAFVVLAAAGINGSAWLIVLGFAGHGMKDLWQHRTHYVANTRWWPPFCMTIDFVAAAIIAVAIMKGVTLHQ